MELVYLIPYIVYTLSCIGVGLLFILAPAWVIESQRICYKKANWHIEPISMERELRNIRYMGVFLIVVTVVLSGIFFSAFCL